MRVLIVRHAEAAPASAAGGRDRDRPLTANGRRVFRAAAREIARRLPAPDVLLASPLLRAQETAAFLAAEWGTIVTADDALASGSVDAIVASLVTAASEHAEDATIALVGHEPTVSALVAALAGGEARGFSPGAAALVETAALAYGAGRLVWFLSAEAAASSR